MSGPNDVDRLLHEWEEVASTATPPAQDPRRDVRATGALPVSMLVVAVVAIGIVAIVGRSVPGPGSGEPAASMAAAVPSAKPPSERPTASPVDVALSDRGIADDGRFLVELSTDGTTFEEGETIRAQAEVTFLGPEASLVVGHGSPPVTFMVEEVGGTRSAGGGMDAICERSTFVRDEAVPFHWERSGGYSTSNPGPNDRFAMEYLRGWSGNQDGELRLPAGTWRLSASLDVAEGDCGPTDPRTASVVIRVDPATTVGPEPSATPGEAGAPTPTPVLTGIIDGVWHTGPVVRCDRVTAEDCEHAIALVRDAAPDAYGDAAIVVVSDTCDPDVVCDRQYAFDSTVLAVPAAGMAARSPTFRVQGVSGPEFVGEGPGYLGSWMPAIVDEAAELVPLLVGLPHAPGAVECPAAALEGTLVEDERFGLAVETRSVTSQVRWPFGHARDDAGGVPSLVDPTGHVVAQVGDEVLLGGGIGIDPQPFLACGGVGAVAGP